MKNIINLNIPLSKEDWFFLLNALDDITEECRIIEEKKGKYHRFLSIYNTIMTELLENDFLKYN